MQRFVTVSYGYLKFGFGTLLLGTVLCILAGLAMTSPTIFLVVVALSILAFFAIRAELQTKRRNLENSKRADSNPQLISETFTQWLAFAQATSLIVETIPSRETTTLWVYNLVHLNDPKLSSANNAADPDYYFRIQVSQAAKALEKHSKEFERHGLYPTFLTPRSPIEVVESMKERHVAAKSSVAIEPSQIAPRDATVITIGFFQTKDRRTSPASIIAKILKGSFKLLGGEKVDILERDKTTRA